MKVLPFLVLPFNRMETTDLIAKSLVKVTISLVALAIFNIIAESFLLFYNDLNQYPTPYASDICVSDDSCALNAYPEACERSLIKKDALGITFCLGALILCLYAYFRFHR